MERAIREILADPGILGDAAESMASDADLRLAGINSMQVLQILTAIEDRFAIEVPDEVVRPETFSSIQALATAIETVAGREPSVRRDDTRFPGQSEHHSRTPAGQMSASGVVLTSSADESVHSGLRAGLAKLFAGEVGEHYTAPPVIARSISERVGYPTSFPHLLGEVHGAREGETAARPTSSSRRWRATTCTRLFPKELGRTPAA